ncbi:pre-rRNA processing protein [Colletotrichum truncatum]|uniref:Pre-rRNA processing protein n=1 Tax=Colletotrichum truncatum TaxID=5467 RepID=A0ACC3YES9_COLTU|nr:pre-rRNA processing protein [Colletotrichum truncatum]KAF6783249.1 pre-rRNA processing protein [Colletotrichum truncatum]
MTGESNILSCSQGWFKSWPYSIQWLGINSIRDVLSMGLQHVSHLGELGESHRVCTDRLRQKPRLHLKIVHPTSTPHSFFHATEAKAFQFHTTRPSATTAATMSSKSGKNGKITDSRFSNFETDPRFRLPSKKQTKTTIDKRFSRMLKDDSFTATAKVDRYGRKVKSDSKKKALERLYEAEDGEDDMEVEEDDVVERELAKADAKYDPARGGGFSESESESESSDDDDDEEEAEVVADPKASMSRLRDEQADVEDGEVTNRIAIVNLDWDNIKSADLFALFTSFLPPVGGRIEKVSVYPSEFGKERMQREELEGPPKEIFKNDDDSDESSDEEEDEAIKKELLEEGDAEDFDSDALRKYQLDRLRYYYAVMVCSDKATAQKLYEATDGTEYQSSSNFLDLRFVPDDVTFDDEPRDECDKIPEGYKPVEFITDALQHSKVKLTWDVNPDDAARKASINRAFTGSRAQLEENDLKAYLASDSEDEDEESLGGVEEEVDAEAEAEAEEPKLSKKELQRRKMREMLGLGAEEEKKSKDVPVGDMEITFTPALTETQKDKKKEGEEETTIEKYKRKERERKEKKREMARAKREGADVGAAETQKETEEQADDLGFDDPFFTAEEPAKKTKTAVRKEERLAKRAAREAEEKEKAEQKAQLKLLMADDDGEDAEHLDHFDMNEILRAEKQKKKKGKGKNKKNKKGGDEDDEKVGLQEGFNMNVGDDRFKAVFESHEYAIDPSNPKFKATEGMQKLLEEGRKKRKVDDEEPPAERQGKKAKKDKKGDADDLGGLVASVKRKAGGKAGKK